MNKQMIGRKQFYLPTLNCSMDNKQGKLLIWVPTYPLDSNKD